MVDNSDTAVGYLMEGDPAIRWQAMRDLLAAAPSQWQAERRLVSREGWGRRFLDCQLEDGSWQKERWTDTVWTLVQMCELGLIGEDDQCRRGFERVVGRHCPIGTEVDPVELVKIMDLCHLGFWLRIGSTYCPDDPRLGGILDSILLQQLPDGGWNCRTRTKPKTTHSSFHTTFNVLEGLRAAHEVGLIASDSFLTFEDSAVTFMLEHHMYRSDKTGTVIDERFLDLTFPSHWHYTVLRGLDYLSGTKWIHDPRLDDALTWLTSRRKANGLWIVEKRIPGTVHFDMEAMGKDSRWNTLRALRVLFRAERLRFTEGRYHSNS